jgi:predicted SAM-dependent methyltransferase
VNRLYVWGTAPIRWPARALLRVLPPALRQAIGFELASVAGRTLARRLRVDPAARNYLDLGAADDGLEGFVSLDFFTNHAASYGADLRFPLLIDDAVFDGIFTEHTLEHLSFDEVKRLLAECLRIMKPGGRIRVIVPDASIVVENYVRKNDRFFAEFEDAMLAPRGRKLQSRMEALSFELQENGHRSAWDFETMSLFLERAGFADITCTSYRQGADPRLLCDRDNHGRRLLSLYIEARRP